MSAPRAALVLALPERVGARLEAGTGLAHAAAEALPFSADSFDVVLCAEVVEHTRDPRAVMELVRVAGEGGRVVVFVPHETRIDRVRSAAGGFPFPSWQHGTWRSGLTGPDTGLPGGESRPPEARRQRIEKRAEPMAHDERTDDRARPDDHGRGDAGIGFRTESGDAGNVAGPG